MRDGYDRTGAAAASLLAALLCAASASAECEGVPRFLGMYGNWKSFAFKAEPAEILDEHPEWAKPNEIRGVATEICPGIRFMVKQVIAGKAVSTELTYVYDPDRHVSHGVIASSTGARLRGILEHGPNHSDELTLLDFDGNVVWRESKTWVSEVEFESVARIDFHGSEGRVWFRTFRVGEDE